MWIPEILSVWESGPFEFPVYYFWLTNIDVERALDSGYSVVTKSFALDTALHFPRDFTHDGARICALTDKIIRMEMDGSIVDSLPLPVLAAAFTWDGEAFWIIHHGPPDAYSDNLLLSRFYPR